MWALVRNHPRALLLAVLIHITFFALLVVSFHFSARPTEMAGKQDIVHAVTVDESKVQAELAKLNEQAKRKHDREAQQVREQEQAAERARKARQQEQQRLAELKQQREAEQERVAAEQRKRQAEQASLAKAKAEQARLAKERAEEVKRLAALKAQQQKEQAAEKKRREAEEARQKAKAQKALQAKIDAEAKRMAAERAAQQKAQRQTEIDKYTARIRAAIRQHWDIPPSAEVGMSCKLRLHLIPGGDVIKIDMLSSSGDAAVDQSVIAAVKAASPLPVPPPQSGLFDSFRSLNLPFDVQREDLKQQG